MKQQKNGKLYVQLSDLKRLVTSGKVVPKSIYLKYTIFSKFLPIGTYIPFSKKEEIEFLNKIPFIIDYNDERTPEEIRSNIRELKESKDSYRNIKPTNFDEFADNELRKPEIELTIKALEELLDLRQREQKRPKKRVRQ